MKRKSGILVLLFLAGVTFTIWFSRLDIMQKYVVYQQDNYVIVEYRGNPEKFYYKEWIQYGVPINAAYLCTKDGKKARSENEAFLFLDFVGDREWWGDPFGNLDQDAEVKNEYIPDSLIGKLAGEVHIAGSDVNCWIDDETEKCRIDLMDSEIEKIAPNGFEGEYICYQIDFDNDGIEDLVIQDCPGMGHDALSTIYFYRLTENGQYRNVHFMESWGERIGFLKYNGKIYYITIRRTWFDISVPETKYDYQWCKIYYFQDGYPQETVWLVPECYNSEQAENNQDNDRTEDMLNVIVKKRFVNDFINTANGH